MASADYRARPAAVRALTAREVGIDLAGDVAFEHSDDLRLGAALLQPALHVHLGPGIGSQAGDHDAPQRRVGLAVAAPVEAVAGHLARGRLAVRRAALVGAGGLGAGA